MINDGLIQKSVGEQSATALDFSLRANGDTYFDRTNETEQIFERIRLSSAWCIGISGARGAGKSSLARRVLTRCVAANYFTLLVPSPTSYDPREFLLTVCQRIAEECSNLLRRKIFAPADLSERGRAEIRKLQFGFYARACIAIFLATAVALAVFYYDLNTRRLTLVATLRQQTLDLIDVGILGALTHRTATQPQKSARSSDEDIAADIQVVVNQMRRFEPVLDDDFDSAVRFKLNNPGKTLPRTTLSGLSSEVIDLFERFPISQLSYTDLLRARELVIQNYRGLEFYPGVLNSIINLGSLPLLMLIAVLALASLVFLLKDAMRRYSAFSRHPKEVGLYYKCQDFLEIIQYQVTLTTSGELSLTGKLFSGKLTRGKQLEDRPLSLPGLTALCGDLIIEIARVFEGHVVICIDELDKITDSAQLAELLKGIKGLLGQDHAYFLLTVSDDATASFNERYSGERTMLESSLDDIIYLDRVDLGLAKKIGAEVLPRVREESPESDQVARLIWIFSGGVPREIKRLALRIANLSPSGEMAPFNVWRAFYLEMLRGVSTSLENSADGDIQARFEILLAGQRLTRLTENTSLGIKQQSFVTDALGMLAQQGTKAFLSETLELLIGAIAFACRENSADAEQLVAASKFLWANPLFAQHVVGEVFARRFPSIPRASELTTDLWARRTDAM